MRNSMYRGGRRRRDSFGVDTYLYKVSPPPAGGSLTAAIHTTTYASRLKKAGAEPKDRGVLSRVADRTLLRHCPIRDPIHADENRMPHRLMIAIPIAATAPIIIGGGTLDLQAKSVLAAVTGNYGDDREQVPF
jgi:hypothetical protein